METEKDKELWKLAKKRVGFKRHLMVYILTNAMFWCVWAFTQQDKKDFVPWPLWPMLGWGIGLAFNYFDAYVFTKNNAVEKEFEKLKSGN